MTVELTLRSVKGAPLSHAEIDANYTALRAGIEASSVVEPVTGAQSISADDSGTAFTNEGASAIVPMVLPFAEVGLLFTFIVRDADGLRVTAQAGDTINIEGDVWDAIESVTVGSVVRLKAINAAEWVAITSVGSWTEA